MSMSRPPSRRAFLQGSAALATLALPRFARPAAADDGDEPGMLFIVYLSGGYNAIFSSADSFLGTGMFGVRPDNVLRLANGLVVDSSFGALPQRAREHMASIGVAHGQSDHGAAQRLLFSHGNQSAINTLAAAMGGSAQLKAVALGTQGPLGPRTAVNGVAIQQISDMTVWADQLRGDVDVAAIAAAYGTPAGAIRTFASQAMAAELAAHHGVNVVVATQPFVWDSHGDTNGSSARARMRQTILPALGTFLDRMLDARRNVVTVLMGDFLRSPPGSDHGNGVSATVIGRHVRGGTTGRVNANGALLWSPSVANLWAYLAAALRVPSQPFGANPHALILP
jgi:hypothetical protein